MLTHQDTVKVSAELGRAHFRFEEALNCLKEGDLTQARMKLRGAASRMLQMANILERASGPQEARHERPTP
jgi:hypothetical protein